MRLFDTLEQLSISCMLSFPGVPLSSPCFQLYLWTGIFFSWVAVATTVAQTYLSHLAPFIRVHQYPKSLTLFLFSHFFLKLILIHTGMDVIFSTSTFFTCHRTISSWCLSSCLDCNCLGVETICAHVCVHCACNNSNSYSVCWEPKGAEVYTIYLVYF